MHRKYIKISKKYIQYSRIFNTVWYERHLSSRCCVLHIDSMEKDLSLPRRMKTVGVAVTKSRPRREAEVEMKNRWRRRAKSNQPPTSSRLQIRENNEADRHAKEN